MNKKHVLLLLKLLAKISKSMQGKNYRYIVLVSFFFLSTIAGIAQQNQTDKLGRKQGKWVKYQDGVKRYEGQFVDGYPVGTFLRYYKSGRLKSKAVFSQKGKRNQAELLRKASSIFSRTVARPSWSKSIVRPILLQRMIISSLSLALLLTAS